MEDSDVVRRIVTGCSLTAALEVVGERWSFLILRGAFNGLEDIVDALGTKDFWRLRIGIGDAVHRT